VDVDCTLEELNVVHSHVNVPLNTGLPGAPVCCLNVLLDVLYHPFEAAVVKAAFVYMAVAVAKEVVFKK
jgi:hypothetical protein